MLTRKGTWTVRQAAESMVVSGRNLLIVGTPDQVVDELAGWVEHADVDGFNIARILAHETMENFIDMVVPELQQRGMFKTEYRSGTLREKLRAKARAQQSTTPPPAIADRVQVMRRFSMSYLTALVASPLESIRIAAEVGYDHLGLRIHPTAAADAASPLLEDKSTAGRLQGVARRHRTGR